MPSNKSRALFQRLIQSASRSHSPNYRPDIDGLRAVAVGLVLLFHAASDRLPGGYLGVDVFFVISGFLITGIILARIDRGEPVLATFYRARVQRLYPALITVIISTIAMGGFFFATDVYRELGRQSVASSLFSANFYFWFTTNYFQAESDHVLIHLWSLGVEEQFYFIWPLALLGVTRLGRRSVPWLVGLILIASLALNIWTLTTDPTEAFFAPWTRAWELMSGAMLNLLPRFDGIGRRSGTLPMVALAAIVCAALFPEQMAFFGVAPLAPVIASCVLIASRGSWINRRLLAARPLMFGGLISYPLYLWHWPILSLLEASYFGSPPPAVRLAGLVLAGVLAVATYLLIENRPFNARAMWLLGAMSIVAVVGMFLARDGIPGRAINQDPRHAFVQSYDRLRRSLEAARLVRDCNFYDTKRFVAKERISGACAVRSDRPSIVIWGDSHAQALYSGVRNVVPSGIQVLPLASSDCPPTLRPVTPNRTALSIACFRSTRNALATISRTPPRVLILAQWHDHQKTEWDALARWAKARGVKRVILVGPTPNWHPSLPAVIVRSYWAHSRDRVSRGLSAVPFQTDQELASRYAASRELDYISLISVLCNKSGCIGSLPGQGADRLIVSDYGHLSPWGSDYVSRVAITPALAP